MERSWPSTLTWFDLTDGHGALELHERLANGVGLELHVVICADGATFAWWATDDCCWTGVAEVGQA